MSLQPEDLICTTQEDWTIQCVVVENNVRCNHGSRSKGRQLCSKHYAQWQRNGRVGLLLPNGGSLTKRRREAEIERREKIIQSKGCSILCLCTHRYREHGREGCKMEYCKCKSFEGANELMFKQVMKHMKALGFYEPLNDLARCWHCLGMIRVGPWYDQMAISRMREHLRVHMRNREYSSRRPASG